MLQPDRLQMAKRRMRFALWKAKAMDTHSKYVTRFAFQLK